jgi:hypothetical protein
VAKLSRKPGSQVAKVYTRRRRRKSWRRRPKTARPAAANEHGASRFSYPRLAAQGGPGRKPRARDLADERAFPADAREDQRDQETSSSPRPTRATEPDPKSARRRHARVKVHTVRRGDGGRWPPPQGGAAVQ